jgi:predicted TIM-barrel fold metal-dependent hydrolase
MLSPTEFRLGRRAFLRSAAFAAAGTVAGLPKSLFPDMGTASLANEATRNPKRVDAHLHCFAGTEDPRFPYHERAPYRPADVASPEQLLRCMDEGGVDYAIVVHPEPYQDDHRYLEHCLRVGAGRLKGTCLFFSERPDAKRQLRQLASRLPIVAARVHAYAPDRLPRFDGVELREFWKAAGELGLAIQLHLEPRYAPALEPLIRDLPETRVLIDHLGRPMQGTHEEHDVIVRWSRFPHTIMKFSSIPSVRNYPHRDPATVIKRLLSAYGPERMIYGGGFSASATGSSYRAAFEAARAYLSDLSDTDQARILGENARQLFGFPS